jgi:hypothetical protein
MYLKNTPLNYYKQLLKIDRNVKLVICCQGLHIRSLRYFYKLIPLGNFVFAPSLFYDCFQFARTDGIVFDRSR